MPKYAQYSAKAVSGVISAIARREWPRRLNSHTVRTLILLMSRLIWPLADAVCSIKFMLNIRREFSEIPTSERFLPGSRRVKTRATSRLSVRVHRQVMMMYWDGEA